MVKNTAKVCVRNQLAPATNAPTAHNAVAPPLVRPKPQKYAAAMNRLNAVRNAISHITFRSGDSMNQICSISLYLGLGKYD